MLVEVITPPEHFSAVLADLTRRRSIINSIDIRGNSKVNTLFILLVNI